MYFCGRLGKEYDNDRMKICECGKNKQRCKWITEHIDESIANLVQEKEKRIKRSHQEYKVNCDLKSEKSNKIDCVDRENLNA